MKKDKDKDKDKVKEISNIDFIYQAKTFTISYSGNEKLKETFQSFVKEINKEKKEKIYILNEFIFFYEGKKLEDDSKMTKDIIIQDKKNIIVKGKLRIIKCPQCICNDCIINLNNYHLAFYDCKYKHKNRIYLLNEYDKSQEVNFSDISCCKNECQATISDTYEDFYECLTCTKKLHNTNYFCSKHKEEHEKSHKTHIQVRYDDKNYFCEEHFDNFIKYCFICNKNLCKECLKDHQGKNHKVKCYKSLIPNLDDIKNDLIIIKEKIDDLEIFINNIKKTLDGAYKLYDNYYKIANDITEKYELYIKDLKNYKVLRNFLNLKISNRKIIKDLNEIVSTNDLGIQSNKLINIYKEDRGKYNKTQDLNLEKHGIDDYNEWKEENAINETKK